MKDRFFSPSKDNSKKKYNIECGSNYNGYFSKCTIEEHEYISSFSIYIKRFDDEILLYNIHIKNVLDISNPYNIYIKDVTYHKNLSSGRYNDEKTIAIQKHIVSQLNGIDCTKDDSVSREYIDIDGLNVKSTIDCVTAISKFVFLDEKDKNKIIEFIEAGKLTQPLIIEHITNLFLAGQVQESFDFALQAERNGNNGILYIVAMKYLFENCLQPAYIAFSAVPNTDLNYAEAQVHAGHLLSRPQIKFDNEMERYKCRLTHYQNAGEYGQGCIDDLNSKYEDELQIDTHAIPSFKNSF